MCVNVIKMHMKCVCVYNSASIYSHNNTCRTHCMEIKLSHHRDLVAKESWQSVPRSCHMQSTLAPPSVLEILAPLTADKQIRDMHITQEFNWHLEIVQE